METQQTRTFQAREIREALALVRRELGPDAVILDTRRVPGKALGLLGGMMFEVTAAATATSPAAGQTASAARPTTASAPSPIAALMPERRAQRQRDAAAPSVREMIEDAPAAALAAASTRVAPHAALRRRLLASMVPRDVCEQWLRQLADTLSPVEAEAKLREDLRGSLGASSGLGSGKARVVAFVGPTGVGKTTTVAKLAARARLVDGKSVALVSLDDGRLGGTAAIRAYGRVLDVPVRIVGTHDLAAALAEHADAELVLVDTAGISPATPSAFVDLGRRLERAGEPVFTHLCVAAATRAEELERIAHLYRVTAPDALLVTKVDEAVAIGSALALRMRSDLSFSFFTTGPAVPDDLHRADPELALDLLLGGKQS
jgi:flagellar biosynthesis protein FlhF